MFEKENASDGINPDFPFPVFQFQSPIPFFIENFDQKTGNIRD